MADNRDDSDNKLLAKFGNDLVDVDAIEVSVLILAKHPNGQRQAAGFLNKRGWPTIVTGSISEALDILVNRRPDVVLVSFNHPHPAILKLPDVLTQSFNIFCIGYVETSDAVSTARLAQAKILYKLQGFPSGPSVQRLIRKILEERLGPGAIASGEIVAKSFGKEPKEDSSDNPEANIQFLRGNKSLQAKYVMETAKVKRKFREFTSPGGDEGVRLSPTLLDPSKRNDLLDKLKKTLLPETHAEFDSEAGIAIESGFFAPPEETIVVSSPTSSESDDILQKQALLEQAVESAFRKPFGSASSSSKVVDLFTSRVAVMSIDSPALHGYLVAAPPEPMEKKIAEQFLSDIRNSLETNFVSLSVPGRIDAGFWIDVPEVEFNQWLKDAALFNLKVPYEGSEVSVGYFPTHVAQIIPKKSTKSSGLYSVDLKIISTEIPVTFKAYLPMENGKKPFLYLRNGRTLQPEQKERLLSNNVQEICLKGVDVENFKAFVASMHLQGTMKKRAA